MPKNFPLTSRAKEKSPSPRERKKGVLREVIYEAAIELFLKKGFDNVTVENITQKVDIAKGTFFNYFPSKESILLYFMKRHLDEVKEEMDRDTKRFKTAQKKLNHLFSLLVRLVVVNEPLVKWVLIESLRMRAYQREKKQVSGKILQTMVEILKAGHESGELKKNMGPEKIAKILESIFFFSSLRWLTFDRHTNLLENVLENVKYIFQGIKA